MTRQWAVINTRTIQSFINEEQIKPFALQTGPFNSFAPALNSSLKVSQNIKFQHNLELFLFVPKRQQKFFCFYGILRVFLFLFFCFGRSTAATLTCQDIFLKTQNVQLFFFVAAPPHFPFHRPDLSVQGSSASLGPQSGHRPLGNPRGKANCIFYKSLLLLLPFLPSFFPCFLPSSLPSCFCEEGKQETMD